MTEVLLAGKLKKLHRRAAFFTSINFYKNKKLRSLPPKFSDQQLKLLNLKLNMKHNYSNGRV